MQAPETVETIMTTGRNANYRVEVHVLTVDPRVSWQGNWSARSARPRTARSL